jgi:Fe-S oxidoreductase
MKIAFVVQRYGLEVNGGAELLCRQMAEHLSKHCNVEVITTCAIDYMTWRNEYKEGTDVVNGINVHRFPVDKPRNVEIFNRMSEKIFYDQPHTKEDELK